MGQERGNLPNGKLRLLLLTAGNPLETLDVRKGWPKRGRWRLFHYDQTEEGEKTSEIPLKNVEDLATLLSKIKSASGKNKLFGTSTNN